MEHSILRTVSLSVTVDECLCQCQDLSVPASNGEGSNFMMNSWPSMICKFLSDVLVRLKSHRIMNIFDIQQLSLSNYYD